MFRYGTMAGTLQVTPHGLRPQLVTSLSDFAYLSNCCIEINNILQFENIFHNLYREKWCSFVSDEIYFCP